MYTDDRRQTVHDMPCVGNATTTHRVRGELPRLLPAGVEDPAFQFEARHFPPRVTLTEYHNGINEPPRNVQYALNTLLHHGLGHFTAHGFVPNGAQPSYPFLHDANVRPLVRPAPLSGNGVLSYDRKVSRAWYTRVDPPGAV